MLSWLGGFIGIYMYGDQKRKDRSRGMGLFGGQGIEGHLPGTGKVADLVLQGVMLLPAASCDVALFAAAAPPRWPPRPLRFRPLERQVAATRALYRYCITEG